MDVLIKQVRRGSWYKMGDKEIRIICFVDHCFLQKIKIIFQGQPTFSAKGKKYNIQTSAEQNKIYDHFQLQIKK